MASYGELVLVVGDFHIPHRAPDIHEQFKKLLGPNKIQHVLCTGNLCTKDQVDFLKALAPRVHIVRGDFDDDESFPEQKVVTIGSFRIGLIHGHQIAPVGETEALAAVQRSLDVDVLVSGHTHHNTVVEYDGKAFVNPGSITGAYHPSAGLGEVIPSFMLMNITESRIEFFLYELLAGDKLKISRSMYNKGGGASGAVAGSAASTGATAMGGAGATGSAASAATAAATS